MSPLEDVDTALAALAAAMGVELDADDETNVVESIDTDLDRQDIEGLPGVLRAAAKMYEQTMPEETRAAWREVISALERAAKDIEGTIAKRALPV